MTESRLSDPPPPGHSTATNARSMGSPTGRSTTARSPPGHSDTSAETYAAAAIPTSGIGSVGNTRQALRTTTLIGRSRAALTIAASASITASGCCTRSSVDTSNPAIDRHRKPGHHAGERRLVSGEQRTIGSISRVWGRQNQRYPTLADHPAVVSRLDQPVAARIEHVLSHVSKVHPQVRTEFESAYAVWWKKVPYNMGGYASGRNEARRQVLSKVDNRILLGSAAVTPHSEPDWQEGTVSAGSQIASRTRHARVNQPASRRQGCPTTRALWG